jgi:hypothetical protein
MFLTFFAGGLTVNNSVAVFDALFGRKNEFLRTPKFGIVKKGEDWRGKEYVLPFTKTTLLEIFFALYGVISIFAAIFSNNALYTPIIAIPTIGFAYVAYLSISHSFGKKSAGPRVAAPVRRTAGQRILLPGVLAFLVLGAGVAYYGYYVNIYPLQMAAGYLVRAESAQTPEQLTEYLRLAERSLPESGNPVWIFPTIRTDFTLMQNQLGYMLDRAQMLTSISPQNEAYNAAMLDLHSAAEELEYNLDEAIPFMYISPTNIAISAGWVAVIMGVFAAMRHARARSQRQATASVKV